MKITIELTSEQLNALRACQVSLARIISRPAERGFFVYRFEMNPEDLKAVVDAAISGQSGPSIHPLRYSQHELQEAFKLVQPANNWKNPIDTHIPADKRDVVEAAIIHFFGGGAEFTPVPRKKNVLRVKAPGYYAIIGS